jgi:aspartyl-tRNA(Asn)/glutamyl-tRNA(Gln) amidotransferase subunit A
MDGVFPLVPTFETVGPMARSVEDVAVMWSVLAGAPVPEPGLEGLTVGLLTRPPSTGEGSWPEPSDAAEQWAGRLQELGARVVQADLGEPEANTWPVFYYEALRSHSATWPSRRDEYSDNVRRKLERSELLWGEEIDDAYKALRRWRSRDPGLDLVVSPCVTIDLPPEDCDEPEIRLPFSQWLRPFNLLGWAALAIGNLQLAAPRDETVLAAGLAWERG